jgi:hypothetical protein
MLDMFAIAGRFTALQVAVAQLDKSEVRQQVRLNSSAWSVELGLPSISKTG